jgi:hypothetical protein
MATSALARAWRAGCARKRQSAKMSGSTPALPNEASAATSRPLGERSVRGPTMAPAKQRPSATCTQAAIGSGSSDQPAPAATVDATDEHSIAGRKTLYTHRARARVVGASRRPTRVASTPNPQHVSSSATALSDDVTTAGWSASEPSDGSSVPPRSRHRAQLPPRTVGRSVGWCGPTPTCFCGCRLVSGGACAGWKAPCTPARHAAASREAVGARIGAVFGLDRRGLDEPIDEPASQKSSHRCQG